jgi:RHH-type proline utilization regulon transcriptional repressor/proline dehydrogenase/delta 1-pyrroline-5-carboxylate dehydrogenase
MEAARGETLAIMARSTGKTVREGDSEVSEAIDFAAYAAHLTLEHERLEAEGATWSPRRMVVVAGPWNFPYAIPASGLVHALAAGSAAILKPAPQARAVSAVLIAHLQAAGAPEGLLQLACTPDDAVGQHLITHQDVDLVMLTGSYETAALFTGWQPALRLMAETSGKNSMIITQAADIDLAIKDLVRSAFGHAGQKCSAASLAIIEASVYDDPVFQTRLADCVTSVRVGDAASPSTMMGPLIERPAEKLMRGLTQLEPGESWLVQPRCLDAERNIWTPGVRRDVQPGSWFHLTECFGPVLGLMRAPDLDTAITWQNQVDYGLTGGIESLDPAEIDRWLDRVEVGNAYVNRHITGAIVRRQPFGGWKKSSIGPGSKPGGPAHLHSFGTWTTEAPVDLEVVRKSFADMWTHYFQIDHDPSGLQSEANILRYRPLGHVVLRVEREDDPRVPIAQAAADVSGVGMTVSCAVDETDEALTARLRELSAQGVVRLRLLARGSDGLCCAAFDAGVAIDRAPITTHPRIELHHWALEQAISQTMHRHGRLLSRRPPA